MFPTLKVCVLSAASASEAIRTADAMYRGSGWRAVSAAPIARNSKVYKVTIIKW